MSKLAARVLELAAQLRDALDDAGECPETGSTLIDESAIRRVVDDLEFAARAESSPDNQAPPARTTDAGSARKHNEGE